MSIDSGSSNNTYYITASVSTQAFWGTYYVTDCYSDYYSQNVKKKSNEINAERLAELLRKEAEYDALMDERHDIERASLRSGRMIAI
jgi:hypothetical protein